MSLNISKYPWKAWINCSDFGRALNMLEHLTCSTGFLKMPWVLNVSWFWIWRCIFYMTQYVSITPKYFSVHLNVPEYAWSWLKITEFPWVSLEMPEWTVLTMQGFSICPIILYILQGFEYTLHIKHARVLNMPWYSYNNIVTNVILLEFLSAQCVYIQMLGN